MALVTMHIDRVKEQASSHAENFWYFLSEGHWTLAHAHDVLTHPDEHKLDLFQIAGLAMAIASFQCSE